MSFKELEREICLGRLIWMGAETDEESYHLSSEILNQAGFRKSEILGITASQFISLSILGFPSEMLAGKRIILIHHLDSLTSEMIEKLIRHLSQHRQFKLLHEVCLVVSSSNDLKENAAFTNLIKMSSFRAFSLVEKDGSETDVLIHDWIEKASSQLGKKILSMTESAATSLEDLFLSSDENRIKNLVFLAVQNARDQKITLKDIDVARHKVNSLSF